MGDSQIVLAGGSDSMSQAPYAVRGIRFGTKLGVDIKLEDMMWAALTDFHCKTPVSLFFYLLKLFFFIVTIIFRWESLLRIWLRNITLHVKMLTNLLSDLS